MPIDGTHETITNDSTQTEVINKGGEVDFQALFGQTQEKLKVTEEKAERVTKDFESFKGETQKMQETLNRIRSAVVGDEKTEDADPYESEISAINGEIEDYIAKAMEAERAGRPMPVTAKIGIENAKFRIKSLEKEREQAKKIKELEDKLGKVANPEYVNLQQLYDNTDHMVQSALNGIYPDDDQYNEVKNTQFEAITKQIGKAFAELRKDHADDFQRLRRDPQALRKLVNHFVKQNIPPVARQLMEQDEVRRKPMSFEDYFAAFREQKEIVAKNPKDAKARQLLQELKGKVWQAYGEKQLKGKRANVADLI